MATMPKYGKFHLLWIQHADFLRGRYKALGTRALQSLFKCWSGVDHDLLYGRMKLLSNASVFENAYIYDLIEAIEAKFGINTCSWLSEYMHQYIWLPEVKAIVWPLSVIIKILLPSCWTFHLEPLWSGDRICWTDVGGHHAYTHLDNKNVFFSGTKLFYRNVKVGHRKRLGY